MAIDHGGALYNFPKGPASEPGEAILYSESRINDRGHTGSVLWALNRRDLKMNTRKLDRCLLACLASLILIGTFGCASSGNQFLKKETEESISQKITEGKTTRAEVRSMFGSPATTTFTDGGSEIWTYVLADLHADAVNYIPFMGLFGTSYSGTKKELVILYDLQSIVKRYSMSESDHANKTGIFK